MPGRRLKRKVLFVLITIVILISAGEILTRLIWSEADLMMCPEENFFYKDHPTLFWVQKPNLNIDIPGHGTLITNSIGLRNQEIAQPKPDHVYRILSLGESSTWGQGVPLSQTYSKVLESLLNDKKTSTTYEVINAGVSAYSIWQSNIYLKEEGAKLHPDMVLIYHLANDFLPSHILDDHNFLYKLSNTDRALYERRKRIAPILKVLFHSRLYHALRKTLFLLPSNLPSLDTYEGGSHFRVPEQDRIAALEGLLETCENIGAQLVIIFPFYEMDYQMDRVLDDFAQKHRIPFVDTRDLYQAHQIEKGNLFLDGVHPTAKGHQVIAQKIFEATWPLTDKY